MLGRPLLEKDTQDLRLLRGLWLRKVGKVDQVRREARGEEEVMGRRRGVAPSCALPLLVDCRHARDGTVKEPSPRRLPRAGEVIAAVILRRFQGLRRSANKPNDGSSSLLGDQVKIGPETLGEVVNSTAGSTVGNAARPRGTEAVTAVGGRRKRKDPAQQIAGLGRI